MRDALITKIVPHLQRLRHVAFSKQRFSVLFFFLLGSIVVYPYAETTSTGFYAFRILSSAIIALTLNAVASRSGIILFLLVLAVPAFLHHLFLDPGPATVPALVGRLLSLGFDLIVIAIIARHVFKESVPTTETIFGALCIYLFVGFAFASIYGLIVSLEPHAFLLDPLLNGHTEADRFDLVYYSFGTMTELGAPGITAVSREVRSVSILEAIIGILYLAVLISRLLSAYRSVSVSVEQTTGHLAEKISLGRSLGRVPGGIEDTVVVNDKEQP